MCSQRQSFIFLTSKLVPNYVTKCTILQIPFYRLANYVNYGLKLRWSRVFIQNTFVFEFEQQTTSLARCCHKEQCDLLIDNLYGHMMINENLLELIMCSGYHFVTTQYFIFIIDYKILLIMHIKLLSPTSNTQEGKDRSLSTLKYLNKQKCMEKGYTKFGTGLYNLIESGHD